jgi:hypothetical protein
MLRMSETQVEPQPHNLVISLDDLWLRCFALGSMNTARELGAFLRGAARPTRHEYNVIAVALNEYFIEIGLSKFLPYKEDDTPIAEHCLSAAAALSSHPSPLTAPNG